MKPFVLVGFSSQNEHFQFSELAIFSLAFNKLLTKGLKIFDSDVASLLKLDPVGSTLRYEMMIQKLQKLQKLCTGSV